MTSTGSVKPSIRVKLVGWPLRLTYFQPRQLDVGGELQTKICVRNKKERSDTKLPTLQHYKLEKFSEHLSRNNGNNTRRPGLLIENE